MKRDEYLSHIKTALSEAGVDQGIIEEVIGDYEEHFRMGIKNNKTEEEICVELGSVDEIIAEISAMGTTSQRSEESKIENSTNTNTFAVSNTVGEQKRESTHKHHLLKFKLMEPVQIL